MKLGPVFSGSLNSITGSREQGVNLLSPTRRRLDGSESFPIIITGKRKALGEMHGHARVRTSDFLSRKKHSIGEALHRYKLRTHLTH